MKEDNMKKQLVLQQSEWYIMNVLWKESRITVTQLYHLLKEEPGWSKSTVNTMLGRMVAKGILGYEQGDKAKLYYPLVEKEQVVLAETENLLNRIYNGSISMMMSTLVKKRRMSQEDIQELYEILETVREKE